MEEESVPSDLWPAIRCERFDGETEREYRERSARIVEIMTGFRKGRIDPADADALEEELMALQEPGFELYRRAEKPRLAPRAQTPAAG